MKKLLLLACMSSLAFACSPTKSFASYDASPGLSIDKKFDAAEVAFIELKKTQLEAVKADEIVIAVPDNFASTNGKKAPGISHYKKAKKYKRPVLNSKRWKDIHRRTAK